MDRVRVVVTAVLVAAGVLAGGLSVAACGSDDSGSAGQQELEQAKTQGAAEQKLKDRQAEQDRRQRELEAKIKQLEKDKGGASGSSKQKSDGGSSASNGGGSSNTGGSTPAPSTGGACGGDVSANGVTTCGFALNVASAYRSLGSPGSVTATSPTTGVTYTMSCSGSSPAVCTGGRGAVVYID